MVGLPRSRFQKDAQMSVGGGRPQTIPPTSGRRRAMTRTAARLPRNSRSPSCINKLRNKLIDTLADVEKLSKALLEEESAMMGVVPMEEQ